VSIADRLSLNKIKQNLQISVQYCHMNSLLYINDLEGRGLAVRPFENTELAKIEADGINTEHAELYWHRLALDATVDKLEGRVRDLAELGSVSIVGFGAGGSMAFHVFDRVRVDIEDVTATSIAGRLISGTFSEFSPRNLARTSHIRAIDPNTVTYPGYYDSVVELERNVSPGFSREDKNRLTILKPKHDLKVPLATMGMYGVTPWLLYARSHHRAGIQGLRAIGEDSREQPIK